MKMPMGFVEKLFEAMKYQTAETFTLPFKMRRATFKGNGLQREIQQGNWNQIRSQIYEGQGG